MHCRKPDLDIWFSIATGLEQCENGNEMSRCVRLSLVFIAALCGYAQEFDPHDPAIIADGVNRASAVVVGRFRVDWCLPWLDGWHCSGAIHVTETLYGAGIQNNIVPFRWKERYGNICLVCEKVSRFHGNRGIWFLARKDGAWLLSGTTASWCAGPSPMDCREAVVQAIGRKKPA